MMANECERPVKQRGRGKQVAGIVLFWIGIVFLVICVIFIAIIIDAGLPAGEIERTGIMEAGFAAFGACVISCPFLLIGVILYFVGRSQAKRVQKQNIPLA